MFNFANVHAIIFDLDDTLLNTCLDFVSLKRRIGCAQHLDILPYVENICCDIKRKHAEQTILQHELEDAKTSTWIEGAQEFVEQARLANLPLAIVTRNSRQATEIKLKQNQINIDLVLTRDDAPAKPDPTALLSIAALWKIPTAQIAYIGDYVYDIEAAHNANMQAWLYVKEKSTRSTNYAGQLNLIPKKT